MSESQQRYTEITIELRVPTMRHDCKCTRCTTQQHTIAESDCTTALVILPRAAAHRRMHASAAGSAVSVQDAVAEAVDVGVGEGGALCPLQRPPREGALALLRHHRLHNRWCCRQINPQLKPTQNARERGRERRGGGLSCLLKNTIPFHRRIWFQANRELLQIDGECLL